MKIIRKSDSQLGTNNSVCSVKEYSFLDNDIDLGVATITGRYPQNKFCLNTISKELVYVLEGTGILHTIKKDLSYKEGDAILIEKNEKFYWESEYSKIVMVCTPAWSIDQYKIVN